MHLLLSLKTDQNEEAKRKNKQGENGNVQCYFSFRIRGYTNQLSLKAKIDLLAKFQLYKYNVYRSPHTCSTADVAGFCLVALVSKYPRF